MEDLSKFRSGSGMSIGNALPSSGTITPTHLIHHVTGIDIISTINLPWVGFTGPIYLIADDFWIWNNAGNIVKCGGVTPGFVYIFVYDESTGKWNPFLTSGGLLDITASADPTSAAIDEEVAFDSIKTGGVTPYSYLWDFGDALPTIELGDLYGYWTLDETSGNDRVCSLGSGPDLLEVGGTVDDEVGRFSNAVSSTIASTSSLRATLSPTIAMADGLTIAIWFKYPAFIPGSAAATMFCLNKEGFSYPGLQAGRFYDSNYIFAEFAWASGVGNSISLPITQLGDFDVDIWHLLVLTYDPATGNFTGQVDDGCMAADPIWIDFPTSGWPADHLQSTVPVDKLATANAVEFDWLRLTERLNGNYSHWGGEVDDLRIYNKVLTPAQIGRIWNRSDEATPAYSYGVSGTQTVTLTINDGCSSSDSDTVDVEVT